MTGVLVADDHPLAREGITAALERHPELQVVGQAEDGAGALEQARRLHPDVLVLDMNMPRMGGMLVLSELRRQLPETRVLMVTDGDTPDGVVDAVAAGAGGLVTKAASADELCRAVLSIADGGSFVAQDLLALLVQDLRRPPDEVPSFPVRALTPAEQDVLRLVADGATDRQIGEQLFISPRTVQNHLGHIRAKTGISRRAKLACWAQQQLV